MQLLTTCWNTDIKGNSCSIWAQTSKHLSHIYYTLLSVSSTGTHSWYFQSKSPTKSAPTRPLSSCFSYTHWQMKPTSHPQLQLDSLSSVEFCVCSTSKVCVGSSEKQHVNKHTTQRSQSVADLHLTWDRNIELLTMCVSSSLQSWDHTVHKEKWRAPAVSSQEVQSAAESHSVSLLTTCTQSQELTPK